MNWPLDIALTNVHTHQCEFTRGYWVGFARACAKAREDFSGVAPEPYLEEIERMLPRDALLEAGFPTTNGFGVRMVPFSVSFGVGTAEPLGVDAELRIIKKGPVVTYPDPMAWVG